MDQLQPGARVHIVGATGPGTFCPSVDHTITEVGGPFAWICPTPKLASIEPGQRHVPVTRIDADRLIPLTESA